MAWGIDLKRKKLSIKWKVFIYLFGFTAFLLGLLWYFQIVHLNTFYKQIKKNELKNAASDLLKDINSDDLQTVMNQIADEYDISINITDSTGKSVYKANIIEVSHIYIFSDDQFANMYQKAVDSGGTVMYEVSGRYREMQDKDDSDINFEPPVFSNQSAAGSDSVADSGDSSGEMIMPGYNYGGDRFNKDYNMEARSVVYIKLITCDDGGSCVLLMSSLITPVDATVYTLRVQFIYISIIFVVLALTVAAIISLIVSRPIVRINNSAKGLAQGDFDVKFEGKSYKEVQELSETLNYAAQELGRTENLRKDLIANVSHDLRTPLTMISAYAEVMRDIPGEDNPENVQVIIDESKRLTTLVNDMLDLSKLQAGVTQLNLVVFDFTTNILAVLKRFSKLTQQSGYSIRFEYRDNVKVRADEYKIYQVVYNLINNAINYAGPDKEVIVHQIVYGNIVRLEVIDHGKGIEEDELQSIWDRYYKVDKTHKRAVQGTGLGLSIVQNILKLHDAKFGVNSTVGKGSTFWFELKTCDGEDEENVDEA